MPGVSATACVDAASARDVVVHHHVGARHQDALEPPPEHARSRRRLGAGAGDQHRLGLQDRLAEDLEPGLAQGAAGLHDVGDHVGDAELDAGLDRAVEPDHRRPRRRAPRGTGATTPAYDVAIRLPASSRDAGGRAGRAGEAERRAAEAERAASPRPWRRSRAAGRGR